MTQLEIAGLGLLVTAVFMTCGWLPSVARQDASTVDPFWGRWSPPSCSSQR
jgi:steroid 5-alpha reductase family enzyme